LKSNFTKISNCILEALCHFPLSGEEIRIISVIFRKTYGWCHKEAAIPISEFEKMTYMDRWHISRTIKRLREREMIFVTRTKGVSLYKFNKHPHEWKAVAQIGDSSSPKSATVLLPK